MKQALKSQDVVLALKLAGERRDWRIADLADAIHVSASVVSGGLKRLAVSRLYNPRDKRVMRRPLLEFLVHGLPYVFPAQLGLPAVGMPTAFSAAPLADSLFAGGDVAIWSSSHASTRGRVVEPLYPSAPDAAAADAVLYGSLALVDALRIGRARERALAAQALAKRLLS
jgi:hypothetical protein